jgi:hypothetical protein
MERTLMYGVGGDNNTLTPLAQFPFNPVSGSGLRQAITATSQRLGPMADQKYHHIIVTCLTWVRFGGVAVAAVVGTDFPLNPGVYLYRSQSAVADHIAFVRDTSVTSNGVIAIGRAEA